jgi:cytochrome subunit of sulfide dehydrogenase
MKLKLIAGTFKAVAIMAGYLLISSAQAADVDKLVAVCADCHGKAGASTESDVPIIGGNSTEFMVNNLTDYQSEERNCQETKYREGSKKGEKTDMCQVVKELTQADIETIADYFSKQEFVRANQTFDAGLAKKGKKLHDKYCETCHTEGGTLSEDDTGIPAGQWIPYLRHTLKEFRTGKRPVRKKMRSRLNKVRRDAGIEALINYYGSFK